MHLHLPAATHWSEDFLVEIIQSILMFTVVQLTYTNTIQSAFAWCFNSIIPGYSRGRRLKTNLPEYQQPDV